MRIALAEKAIPFELVTEVPWDGTTQTPQYNPLEKLPVLIDTEARGDEDSSVYESHFILDWIEYRFPSPKYLSLTPDTKEGEMFAKKVQGTRVFKSARTPNLTVFSYYRWNLRRMCVDVLRKAAFIAFARMGCSSAT